MSSPQPAPVPLGFRIDSAPGPGGKRLVVLQVASPTGLGVYFLDPPSAMRLAGELGKAGRAAASNLVVVGKGPDPGPEPAA